MIKNWMAIEHPVVQACHPCFSDVRYSVRNVVSFGLASTIHNRAPNDLWPRNFLLKMFRIGTASRDNWQYCRTLGQKNMNLNVEVKSLPNASRHRY